MVSESGTAIAPDDSEATHDLAEILIRPREGWEPLQLAELWKCRHLVYFLTWRDLKVRYKQTALGALWAILQPVLMMVVFAQVFGGMAGMSSGDLPYPIFVYAGLLPWTFVSQATGKAAMSVASSERLVEKVYFPRLVIPISAVAGAMVDFFIAFVVLVLMMFWYGIVPPATVALLPVAILLLCLISLGIGVLYASLNITYRDFRHIIGFVLQIWMFLTPSIYMDVRALHPGDGSTTPTGAEVASQADDKLTTEPADIKSLPKSPQKLAADEIARDFHAWLSPLDLNPLTAIIAFFRASILGGPIPWFMLVKSTLVSSLLLTIGLVYFRRTEDRFADII